MPAQQHQHAMGGELEGRRRREETFWVFGGPLPVTSRDDGGPVPAAAAPPVAGGNPFSLDMSASQAARPPVPAYGAAAAPMPSYNGGMMGMGCLGRGLLSPLIPVTLEGQPIGLPALERSVGIELLLELLLSCRGAGGPVGCTTCTFGVRPWGASGDVAAVVVMVVVIVTW